MFSQNVAKITPPSYMWIRSNLPLKALHNQWKAVYYFSGLSHRAKRDHALRDKASTATVHATFAANKAAALAAGDALASQLLHQHPAAQTSTAATTGLDTSNSSSGAAPAAVAVVPTPLMSRDAMVHTIAGLYSHGLLDDAAPLVRHLHRTGALSLAHYAAVLRGLACEGIRRQILPTTAAYDSVKALKLLGDFRAVERAAEAQEVLRMAHAHVERTSGGGRTVPATAASSDTPPASSSIDGANSAGLTQCYNAYMGTLLTCGMEGMLAVSRQVYDVMGTMRVVPTLQTYVHVLLALGLTGQLEEAEHVATFALRGGRCNSHYSHNSHSSATGAVGGLVVTGGGGSGAAPTPLRPPRHSVLASPALSSDPLTSQKLLPVYHALLMVYRDHQRFDKCDELWQGLVAHRAPRPDATTAELYLRSLIDASYRRTTGASAMFGEPNTVEKKRVPLVLAQMSQLGIPRSHLSRPLLHEVEDALRKFSLYRDRFYQWGRAVKQFDFVEFRRRNGWLYGMDEMMPVTRAATIPRRLPAAWDSEMGGGLPMGTSAIEAPVGVFEEQRPWTMPVPLPHLMNVTRQVERMEDTRSNSYMHDEVSPVHGRSTSWSAEVPQTRYDGLYGLAKPNLHRIGIRRHVASERNAAAGVAGEERTAKDEAVLRSLTSVARRARSGGGGMGGRTEGSSTFQSTLQR